ncbi:MAG: protein kinase [Cyanosarcina radialis HA8281-LM2]|nr:protein kinase [Cyanosarcina radialis HA8281-LM2]
MNPIYCSKGHENPTGNRFCQHCGEQLNLSGGNNLTTGTILSDRYRIVDRLGEGSFGRTYLCEDLKRSSQLRVLKEFAPQIQGNYALQKAEELFAREAGVLYKLQHSQIAQFRELFRTAPPHKEQLFLVQDYVEGETYRELLELRKRQGVKSTETEAAQLLFQMLPVLDYLHSLWVIHRDISPENLIRRRQDGLPVLVDFGGVKQIASRLESQFSQAAILGGVSPLQTRVGKPGYAPLEQIQRGTVSPQSDLYSLAATVMVWLTGKEPQQLIDPQTQKWEWQPQVNLHPILGEVLSKMLQPRLSDRYSSAREVMDALAGYSVPAGNQPTQLATPPTPVASNQPTQPLATSAPPLPSNQPTLPLATPAPPVASNQPTQPLATPAPPLPSNQPTQPLATPTPPVASNQPTQPLGSPPTGATLAVAPSAPAPSPDKSSQPWGLLAKTLFVLLVIGGAGAIGWWAGNYYIQSQVAPQTPSPTTPSTPSPEGSVEISPTSSPSASASPAPSTPSASPAPDEQQAALVEQRLTSLGINKSLFDRMVNQAFEAKNPSQRGRIIGSDGPEAARLQAQRNQIATDLLDKIEQAQFSGEAREGMGNFRNDDRQRWAREANQLRLSSRSVNDLTDAKFLTLFPDYSASALKLKFDDWLNTPLGQLWQATSLDQLRSLQVGTNLETITFNGGVASKPIAGNLKPGEGKAYIAQLSQGQFMQLQLTTPENVLLSVYSPTGKSNLLQDSKERIWSGQLPESGYYEFTIISNASAPVDYQLGVTISDPAAAPEPAPVIPSSPPPLPQ